MYHQNNNFYMPGMPPGMPPPPRGGIMVGYYQQYQQPHQPIQTYFPPPLQSADPGNNVIAPANVVTDDLLQAWSKKLKAKQVEKTNNKTVRLLPCYWIIIIAENK